MKRSLFSFILFVACFFGHAQEGIREEFIQSGSLKMIAYSFNDGSRFFVFFGRPTTTINGLEKTNFNRTDIYFSGNESESAAFLEAIRAFNTRNAGNRHAVLRLGNLFIHREWELFGKTSAEYWTEKGAVSVSNREFDRIYEQFREYNAKQDDKIQ